MSSSKKKQLRKEQYMTERQAAAAAEEKKLKRYTTIFTSVIALVLVIFISAQLIAPVKNVIYKNTDAVTVGDHTLTATELNYFYVDSVVNYQNTIYNQYYSMLGSYWSYMLQFSTSSDLADQVKDTTTNATWADYFLDDAIETIKSTYALYDLAVAEKHELTEDEQKSLDSTLSNLSVYATYYGYSSTNAYLRSTYGNGANKDSYANYLTVSAYASSYYTKYSDSLEFTADQLQTFQDRAPYKYSSYTFSLYKINVDDFLQGGKGDDGKYTDAQKEAALKAAKAAADELNNGTYADLDAFLAAVKELDSRITAIVEAEEKLNKSDDTSTAAETDSDEEEETEDKTDSDEDKEEESDPSNYTKYEDVLYSSINSLFQNWIIGDESTDSDKSDEDNSKIEFIIRSLGETTVIEYTTTSDGKETVSAYYVLCYDHVEENKFVMKNVRHILVSFDAEDSSKPTTAEKLEAYKKAQEILKTWEDGEKTEDSFADLANEKSEDTGSNTDGGLYKNIYPNQMVEAFEDWCYDESRQAGDVEIIETDYGYHIMYFVGNTEQTYRDYMIENALRTDTVETWHEGLIENISLKLLVSKYLKTNLAY